MTEIILGIFEALRPDIDGIYSGACNQALGDWRLQQQGMVTTSGVAAASIPVMHLVGIGADVAFLMNRMSVCSYGIGAILGTSAGKGNILESEDFAVILALWAGEDGVTDAVVGKGASSLVGHVGGKTVTKILAKTMCEKAGLLVGKKIGSKLGAKIAAKFAAKLGAKAAGGFIPFLGAAVGGGINLWFITSIADAAETWYRYKTAA